MSNLEKEGILNNQESDYATRIGCKASKSLCVVVPQGTTEILAATAKPRRTTVVSKSWVISSQEKIKRLSY